MKLHLDDLDHLATVWHQRLKASVEEGLQDTRSGHDRLLVEWQDPRTSGGYPLDFALTRALSLAWRAPKDHDPVPVTVLAGSAHQSMVVSVCSPDAWPLMAEIECSADGGTYQTSAGSVARRIRVDSGASEIQALFNAEGLNAPGDLVLVVGHVAKDAMLAEAARRAGVAEAEGVILMLYAPNPAPANIGDRGGPMRNQWRPSVAGLAHMTESWLTEAARSLLFEVQPDTWFDEDYRHRLEGELRTYCQAKGQALSLGQFQETLAEASPLRRFLPAHLSEHFPAVDSVFHNWSQDRAFTSVNPTVWDMASPIQRLELLSESLGLAAEDVA